MDYQELAMECERLPIECFRLAGDLPEVGLKVLIQNREDKVPTMIVEHPLYGLMIISTTGQGPSIDWMENVLS